MGAGPVSFVYDDWTSMFPSMSAINSTDATTYFNLATNYVANDGTSVIQNPTMLTDVLYLTTAHLAYIFAMRTNGIPTSGGTEPPPPIVGRINNATEGSVSVATDMGTQPAAAGWWNQTPFGAAAWMKLAAFRTMRFFARPRRIYNPPWQRLSGPGYW